MPTKNNKVDDYKFVVLWVQNYKASGSLTDLANILKQSPPNVSQRASDLRKKGVQLPKIKRKMVFSPEKLNSYISKQLKQRA